MKKILVLMMVMFILSTVAASFAQQLVATQKGPVKAYEGEYITIECTVTNNRDEPAYDVQISSQNFDKNLGTIQPGETKTFDEKIYIPTEEEVKKDFGPDATLSNPFFIGSFVVTYKDANGIEHTIRSNSLEIPLIKETEGKKGINETTKNATTQKQPAKKSILDMILDFLNAIIQYIRGLF